MIKVAEVGLRETTVTEEMLERDDHVGLQCRARPLMELYTQLMIEEMKRGTAEHEVLAGVTALAACMVAQVLMNMDEPFSDEAAQVVRMVFSESVQSYEDRMEDIKSNPDNRVYIRREAMH